MKSLMAGFDTISNHIGLILFSIALDLLLWFGPRLKLAMALQPAIRGSASLPEMGNPEVIEVLQVALEEFNLFSALRTFPVGIPSLMAGRSSLATPAGKPLTWDVPSLGYAFGLWLLLTVVGMAAGTLYFTVVAQAAVSDKVSWRQALSQWPWACSQVLLLAVAWLVFILMTVIPFSCVFSVLLIDGLGIGQVALIAAILFGGLLIWLLIPLVFSPHGIFVHRYMMWISVRESVRLTRLTLPSTTLLLLAVLVLSEGLDVLWNVPAEASWFTLVGITGHAFVTTSLLAASFVYYRDAGRWVQRMLQRTKLSIA